MKLVTIQVLLFSILAVMGVFTFIVLERVVSVTERVGARYAPQSDRMANMQVLMFRISLEARHAMLVTSDAARNETFERIGTFRKALLSTVEDFEKNVTTDRGREFIQEWRKRDAVFWKLAGEVVAKIQAGDNEGAFRQLDGELVQARNAVLEIIDKQREFQSQLVLSAVDGAAKDARLAETVVPLLAVFGLLVAGWMSWRLAVMLRGAFRRAISVTQRIASGDLGGDIYVRQGDEFGHLFESIVEMQQRLGEVVARVREASNAISAAASEIDVANADLEQVTRGHQQAVDGTREVTLAMNASVTDSAEHARRANELATETSRVASGGGEMIGKVVQTMNGIDESSRRIGEIVNVIDGIAFQTNILALNAAVEAARAGEQGRGFAVVAGEVRALAHRSAQAAREVKGLIGVSVERVQAGSSTVDEAGRTLHGVVASVEQVTELINELARGTREHTEGFAGIARAVEAIDQASTQSARAVQRSSEAARRLRKQADGLREAVAAFER